MKLWMENSQKIGLRYDETSLTYQDMWQVASTFVPNKINEYGVVICGSEDPLEQLYHVFYGLYNHRPVYLGVDEGHGLGKNEDLEDVFLIATTSGTTGRKKFIYKRENQWLHSFNAHGACFDIKREDVLFVNGSLVYTANLYSVLQILNTGGKVVLSKERNPKKWLKTMEAEGCTIGFLVPSKLRLLRAAIGQIWTYNIEITTAGETISEQLLIDLSKVCPNLKVHHYYGAAEIGHVSSIRHEELLMYPQSVGRAFPGVEIKIESGMIYAKSLYGATEGRQFESAYDCGELKGEGYLYVHGRQDEQININGRKFDAGLIVTHLEAFDDVMESKVVPLNKGRCYGLFIVSQKAEESSFQKMIEEKIQLQYPRWHWPTTYRFASNGIYSESGKCDMVKIRRLFETKTQER